MSDERKPMTDEELAEIKKRLDAITSEALTNVPWKAYSVGKTKSGFEYFGIEGVVDAGLLYDRDYGYENGLGIDGEMKATFIANAPTDISRLLAEVERLRQENKRLCGELERLHEEADWLADWLEIESPYCYECEFKDERYSEYEENITWCAHAPDGTNGTCDQSWRKAARKAIEEERNG